jgi:putative restriction endonuclease
MTRAAPELARLLADHLEGAGIPYAIGGALALCVWGFPRATNDADLDVYATPERLDPVFDALVGAGCDVDRSAARSSATERGDFRVRLDGMRIDVFVPSIPLYDSAAQLDGSGRNRRDANVPLLDDARVRAAAFAFLSEQTGLHGDELPWSLLLEGFQIEGIRVPLLSQQGIFKPAVLAEVPLSIRTAPMQPGKARLYEDAIGHDGLLAYRYRGTDREHRDNRGLRFAMERRTPLVYLFGVVEGQYMPAWPVYVVGDDPSDLCFRISVDDREVRTEEIARDSLTVSEARRAYTTALTLRRLHQKTFRHRVLNAYQTRCAVCQLKRAALLDAAHILPDGHPRGEPIVPNGIALCSPHHAAFDRYILGIRPDCVIEVRSDVLEETDGPMLRHGLQDANGQRIHVPRSAAQAPNAAFLEERYELFRRAG